MKTNVSENSVRAFRTIGPKLVDQDRLILMAMVPGKVYTRRELSVSTGIENSAAARAVNGLVNKTGQLIDCGVKRCDITGRLVGAVTLSLADGA